MESRTSSTSFMDILRDFTAVLNSPISISGKILTPSEMRRKRALLARERLSKKGGRVSSPRAANAESEALLTFRGMINTGIETPYSINGQDFMVDSSTTIIGEIKFGTPVTVKGTMGRNGMLSARVITALSPA